MELEKRGIPTVTLCTDAFISLAREESRNLGMPDLPLAIIKHPLGGEGEERVRRKALEVARQVALALTRPPA